MTVMASLNGFSHHFDFLQFPDITPLVHSIPSQPLSVWTGSERQCRLARSFEVPSSWSVRDGIFHSTVLIPLFILLRLASQEPACGISRGARVLSVVHNHADVTCMYMLSKPKQTGQHFL